MPKVRVLSEILASQVAAGEVVERPASVVKELVENSIDAGAREVRVDIDRGGTALIRVSDDGCGMSREDALMSLERHATSKLRSASDLAAIRTLGFRGEAVPSIASVSRFRMITREADAMVGTEIQIEGGRLGDVRDAGCAPGTVVEAKALFFNMPARRKFLRAETTESAHIEHQLRLHALAAPQVRFRLRRDEREIFDLPAAARAVDRVRHLLGPALAGELISLPETRGHGVSVEGFVLPASHARRGRRHQCVFLNGRPVEDAVISRALAEGFRGGMPDGLHPAAWLWIDLDPRLVDVNVHPAKREVRFQRPLDLREAIVEAVTRGLKPSSAASRSKEPAPPRDEAPGIHRPAITAPAAATAPVALVPSPVPRPAATAFHAPQPTFEELMQEAGSESTTAAATAAGGRQGPEFRILGLLHQRFVVMESEGGLVLFDPKAARERILYEALLEGRASARATQPLLVPVLLEFDPRDTDLLLRERALLAEAGIELESFGGNTIQVLTLPAGLGVADPRPFLGGLLDELLHDPAAGSRFAFERLARAMARRAAGQSEVRLVEARPLLDELFTCDLPYCAADGRPTLTEFGLRELEKRFSPGKG